MRIPILGLLLTMLAGAAVADDTWSVRLSDGVTHDGVLVRIEPGRYLLQTGGRLLELTDDDIDPVTFRDHPRRQAAPERPLIEDRHYDELHADGTATVHWQMRLDNPGSQAITRLRFGLAPWERTHADQRQYRDPFGNELTPLYDPPRDQWNHDPEAVVRVTLPLAVPVAPGEQMTINGQETTPWLERTDRGYRYVSAGDYPEDRLVWRKVRLPRGATIDAVDPPPTARFTHDGHEYVMWRRYYKSGEVVPLQIEYTLD